MFFTILCLIMLLAVVILFGLLAVRSSRSKRPVLKWGGLILSSVFALVFALVTVFALKGMYQHTRVLDVPVPSIYVAGTPEQIMRGQHLADTLCTSCHSPTGELPLIGGVNVGDDMPVPLGSYVSTNLTPAGPLSNWSDSEIFRAIRNGVNKDGRRLVVMSNVRSRNPSDEDTLAIIAYLRSQPSVPHDTPQPSDQPNLLAFIMGGAGLAPESPPPILGSISAPLKSATVEYGEYILSYQDCRDCHGDDLGGGVDPFMPAGPNLLPVKYWTTEQFITSMRTGVTPGGDPMDPPMPWQAIGRMDDEELTAMHLYMQSMP
jgi:mono/diheme cytochrome c family protein